MPAKHPADAAATRALLRCWIRETGIEQPRDGMLHLFMRATGVKLCVEVTYWSRCGWHEFGLVSVTGVPADATTIALLIAREATAQRGHGAEAIADLVGRVIDSTQRIERYLTERDSSEPLDPGFLAAEQALVLGHPLHPTPKSRAGLSATEDTSYAPELRGQFPLHWFAAREVRHGSALDRDAVSLLAASAADVAVPAGFVPVPAHPWQAREVLGRPGTAELIDRGDLRYLGPAGPPWSATSSIRTVYRADAEVMLKLSLGLRITNSRREHLPEELTRGEEIHRLLDAGLGVELGAAFPGFGIVRDPAWLAVPGVPGLEVVIRENPFSAAGTAADSATDSAASRVECVAGLTAEGTGPSRLERIIRGLGSGNAAADWFERYIEAVVVPVLWLHGVYGLALEAHQQNTLVCLDDEGWPSGGWYRDNQGYYVTPRAPVFTMLPELDTELVSPSEVIDERVIYYAGVNNLLGVAGALGSAGLADEGTLLQRARDVLRRLDLPNYSVLSTLLDSPTLRCKANLLTRVDGLDELEGPVETQSVYIDIANPLVP